MTVFNRLMTTAALGLALGVTSLPALAETPDNMLVIANRIDDSVVRVVNGVGVVFATCRQDQCAGRADGE